MRKYFYKLAILIDSWNPDLVESMVKQAGMSPKEMDQFEEWNGVTDIHGNPFKYRSVSTMDSIPDDDDESMFPIDTFEGEKVTEKNFKSWLKREMKDYVQAMIENYEWRHGADNPEEIINYVSRKGWIDFVNKFNPLKFVKKKNTSSVKSLSKEFEKQTGRSLKKDYVNTVKRLVRRHVNNI